MSDLPPAADPGSEHLPSADTEAISHASNKTTPAKIEALKNQAERIQRKGGGEHADLLNRVMASKARARVEAIQRLKRTGHYESDPRCTPTLSLGDVLAIPFSLSHIPMVGADRVTIVL